MLMKLNSISILLADFADYTRGRHLLGFTMIKLRLMSMCLSLWSMCNRLILQWGTGSNCCQADCRAHYWYISTSMSNTWL